MKNRGLVGIDALLDKGRGKEGSWEARKIGSWEKEEALRADLNACGGKEGSQEDRKLGKRGSPSGWF